MFVGETNVIDLVGTEAAGFADDLRNQAEIADFDGQAVGYRIGRDFGAFYVIVRRHVEAGGLQVVCRDAHRFDGIGDVVHDLIVLDTSLLGVGISAGCTDGNICRVRSDFLLGIAGDGDDGRLGAFSESLRGSNKERGCEHSGHDEAF